MPYQDGTGPFGDGRPGRGLGPCGRFGNLPRFGFGRGYGYRGRGYGFRGRGWYPYPYETAPGSAVYSYTKEDLLAHKKELQDQLKWIEDQIIKSEE